MTWVSNIIGSSFTNTTLQVKPHAPIKTVLQKRFCQSYFLFISSIASYTRAQNCTVKLAWLGFVCMLNIRYCWQVFWTIVLLIVLTVAYQYFNALLRKLPILMKKEKIIFPKCIGAVPFCFKWKKFPFSCKSTSHMLKDSEAICSCEK